jgi:uracil-DNA glycosylase
MKLSKDWQKVLGPEMNKPYFVELMSKVNQFYNEKAEHIFPEKSKVFNAFNLCSFEDVKVVILGQDPYPTKGHANGLCFSVESNVRPFPKSLNNIFKEIESDLAQPFPENGNLEHWAKQGVFLLNSVLTVEEGRTDSHKGIGWEQFTDRIIELVSEKKENIVFILWGSKAISKSILIDAKKHFILTAVHPSPLSAYRGFFGCKHFSKANEFLRSKDLRSIDW